MQLIFEWCYRRKRQAILKVISEQFLTYGRDKKFKEQSFMNPITEKQYYQETDKEKRKKILEAAIEAEGMNPDGWEWFI